MKLSDRDKMLAMLIPAMLVAAIYGVFFLRGKLVECAKADKALVDARAKAPSPALLDAQAQTLAKLAQENQDLQAKLDNLQQKWRYATCFCAAGPQRNERVEKLTGLLNKHHLRFMKDVEVDAGKDAKLSVSLEQLAQKFAQGPGAQKPQLRQICFHGRYIDVHHALQELADGETLALPVGLTMKTMNDHPDRREWTLLVWI